MPAKAVEIKIDDREFRRALRQIIRTDKKEMAFVLNDQAYRLAAAAMDHTKKAEKAGISKLFRITRVGEQNRARAEAGKKRTKRGHKGNARAFGTYNAWRRLKWGKAEGRVSYDTLERHVNARKSSIGWIKAQWLRAMERVSTSGKKFKKPKGVANVPPVRKLGGYGVKAKPSINPFSMVGVRVDEKGKITAKAGKGRVKGILISGLRAAIPARVADMKQKLARSLAKVHKRHSARR